MSKPIKIEIKQGKWSEEEDERLREAIKIYGPKKWRLIAERVQGRTQVQCLHRWSKILKPGLVKGLWSAHEDLLLKKWVDKEGPKKWAKCAKIIEGRSGKQCRERWFNILDPNVKKGDWTPEEDLIISSMVQEFGMKWTKIAECLSGRTENSVKNRYYSTLKKNNSDGTEIDKGNNILSQIQEISDQIKELERLLNSNCENFEEIKNLKPDFLE